MSRDRRRAALPAGNELGSPHCSAIMSHVPVLRGRRDESKHCVYCACVRAGASLWWHACVSCRKWDRWSEATSWPIGRRSFPSTAFGVTVGTPPHAWQKHFFCLPVHSSSRSHEHAVCGSGYRLGATTGPLCGPRWLFVLSQTRHSPPGSVRQALLLLGSTLHVTSVHFGVLSGWHQTQNHSLLILTDSEGRSNDWFYYHRIIACVIRLLWRSEKLTFSFVCLSPIHSPVQRTSGAFPLAWRSGCKLTSF